MKGNDHFFVSMVNRTRVIIMSLNYREYWSLVDWEKLQTEKTVKRFSRLLRVMEFKRDLGKYVIRVT